MASLINLALNDKRTMNLDTSRNVKPEKPKGYLVNTPLYKVPYVYFQDLAKDTYGIAKGWKGKANDHEIGKQNDVAMKLGILAIAGYLTTLKKSKLPKLMEFVGAGSFLASMALWPKLAIALPLKLRTGVDIQQKYVDSYGRKKNFFQDSQYLAWDLYSKEQIRKIGDKMNVPYDVPNRDEVIKEKARKLSVQGNTLNIVTAGFATPIMAALACNALEPVVEKVKQNYDLIKTQRLMDSRNIYSSSNAASKKARHALEIFLTKNMGSKIETNKQLIDILNLTPHLLMPEYLDKDLDKIFANAQNDITKVYADKIFYHFIEPLTKAGVEKEDVVNAFEKNGLLGAQKDLTSRLKAASSPAETLGEATKEILYKLVDSKINPESAKELKANIGIDGISNVIEGYNRKVLDKKTADKIRNVFVAISNFSSREEILQKWENARFADNADSMGAYSWKNVSKEILSSMGFTPGELKTLASKGPESGKMLAQKMQEIAKDSNRYHKVVTKIAQKIAEYDSVMGENTRLQYKDYVDELCDSAKSALKKSGFISTAEYIGGRPNVVDEAGNILNYKEAFNGTVRRLKKINCDERMMSTKSSLYRFLQTLDLYRRIQDGTFEGSFNEIVKDMGDHTPNFGKVKKLALETILSGGEKAYETKLNLRSTEKNTYETTMRLLYGALPENFVKFSMFEIVDNKKLRAPIIEKALDGTLAETYKAAVNAGFDRVQLNQYRTGMSTSTIRALYEASIQSGKRGKNAVNLVENIKTFMQTFIKNVVNLETPMYRGYGISKHDLEGAMDNLPDRIVSPLVGTSPKEFVRKAAQNAQNSSKWLKMFGISGAVLLVGTVLATLFFGHLPQKEMYMKDGNK